MKETLKLAQRALSNKKASNEVIYKALHAIKEALAQPEHEFVRGECVKCGASIERQEPIPFGIRGGMAHDIGIKND